VFERGKFDACLAWDLTWSLGRISDFKKAFDSVSRYFLFRTLSAFHFGPSFIQWIHTFYNNISSCCLNNGFSTAPFEVQRGVRQGDPLSSCLFIIVLETLTISIRSNKNV